MVAADGTLEGVDDDGEGEGEEGVIDTSSGSTRDTDDNIGTGTGASTDGVMVDKFPWDLVISGVPCVPNSKPVVSSSSSSMSMASRSAVSFTVKNRWFLAVKKKKRKKTEV